MFLLPFWLNALFAVTTSKQCAKTQISSATSNSNLETSCNTDICGISLAGESQKVTLDVLCPYSSVSCVASGYNHQIEINCYKCQVSDRCTNSYLGTQLTYNDTARSTKYSSLQNCDCTAITQCQSNITSNHCPNTYDIELEFMHSTQKDQYIECQRACYDQNDCIYGIYYSSEWNQCRFIDAGCHYHEFIDPSGDYYFVSKGCMAFSNGSFRSLAFPTSPTVAPTKKKDAMSEAFTATTGSLVMVLIFALLCLGRRLFGGRCRRAMRGRNQQNEPQQTSTQPNANNNIENNQIRRNPTYPAAAVQSQAPQSYGVGQQVVLPNGQIAIVQAVPVQQSMAQVPYNPAAHYVPQAGEQPYTLQ